LPFSMLPLLMMTDSKLEMGKRFKNSWWIKGLGWFSVLLLTGLNLYNMPASIVAFFGNTPSASQTTMANVIAWTLNLAIIALLAWTVWELHRSAKRMALEAATDAQQLHKED